MKRERLLTSLLASISIHLLLLLAMQLGGETNEPLEFEPAFEIELAAGLEPGTGGGDPLPPGPNPEPMAPPAVASRPSIEFPKDVRIATQADIEARKARVEQNAPLPKVEVAQETSAEPVPHVAVAAAPPSAAPPAPAAPASSGIKSGPTADGRGWVTTRRYGYGGRGGGGRGKGYGGRFRSDQPGFQGRVLGQVSVRSSRSNKSLYGKMHLFAQAPGYRDYSSGSLFGYTFRQEMGGGGTREFQVGRVQTPGAYLMVTDLYSNGLHSTMGHTVILAFPRKNGSGSLYSVVEESNGFVLRGPGASSLHFDGPTGALRRSSGFNVSPQGAIGSPPRITYRGLHVRIHSVGGNPFLRGRAATVVDARGRRCSLSTADLFAYDGRKESDVFRFSKDADFFRFLTGRCPSLDVPRAIETQVADAREKRKNGKSPAKSEGLIPMILRVFD